MDYKATLMALVLVSSALAGCTGDPDGGGGDEVDTDALQDLFDEHFQDFINNTTITVNYHYYNNSTYITDDGDYSSTTNVEYNNTTINEGDESSTNNYNNQTEYDYSALNYSFGGFGGGNGTGSGEMLYLLDIEFTLSELMPEYDAIDHRNNTINYEYTYYDYLTNSERTDVFLIQCSDYYIVGSQSNGSQVSYWEDSSNYRDAWDNEYNDTVSDMLYEAANAYYYIGSEYARHVRLACDENYNPDGGWDNIHLIDLPIPNGMAINSLDMIRMAWHPTYEFWCAVDASGYPEGNHYGVLDDCYWDWDGDGDTEQWYQEEFSVYGEADWGRESFTAIANWIGGEGISELPIYLDNLQPNKQYRLILYFELVSVINFEE